MLLLLVLASAHLRRDAASSHEEILSESSDQNAIASDNGDFRLLTHTDTYEQRHMTTRTHNWFPVNGSRVAVILRGLAFRKRARWAAGCNQSLIPRQLQAIQSLKENIISPLEHHSNLVDTFLIDNCMRNS